MLFPTLWRVSAWFSSRALARGNAEKAVRIATRYARLRPKDPSAWIIWSRTVADAIEDQVKRRAGWEEGKPWPGDSFAPAEDVLRQGLEVLPMNWNLRVELGSLCHMRFVREGLKEKDEEAHRVLSELHDEDPAATDVLFGLIHVAQARKDWAEFDRVAAELERRLSATEDSEMFAQLVAMMPFAPRGRDRTRSLLKRAINVEPDHPGLYALLGLMMEQEDSESAAREFETGRRMIGIEKFDMKLEEMRALLRRFGPEHAEDRSDPSDV